MSSAEILKQLRSLSPDERLRILESTVHELRQDLISSTEPQRVKSQDQLAQAAAALLDDYSNDSDLTSLTALDGEAFHA